MTAKGAAYDLQVTVVTTLRASTALQALIGNPIRLYQDVQPSPTFPYVTIGEDQNVPDLVQGLDGSEIFFVLHVYSRASGYAECKEIGQAIKACFPADGTLTLAENRCVLVERRNEQHFIDADNTTKHGVYTFRALVEPAA